MLLWSNCFMICAWQTTDYYSVIGANLVKAFSSQSPLPVAREISWNQDNYYYA